MGAEGVREAARRAVPAEDEALIRPDPRETPEEEEGCGSWGRWIGQPTANVTDLTHSIRPADNSG
jgi:hypothetical protein